MKNCLIQSCKGKEDCLQHCPCDCHKTSEQVWDEALTPLIKKLEDMNNSVEPHRHKRVMWDKINELVIAVNKLNRP